MFVIKPEVPQEVHKEVIRFVENQIGDQRYIGNIRFWPNKITIDQILCLYPIFGPLAHLDKSDSVGKPATELNWIWHKTKEHLLDQTVTIFTIDVGNTYKKFARELWDLILHVRGKDKNPSNCFEVCARNHFKKFASEEVWERNPTVIYYKNVLHAPINPVENERINDMIRTDGGGLEHLESRFRPPWG